ncbi:MAG: hypothetical protein HZB55_23905 [Deltaproteobacteria bacterium]|nr:hypothetical protein [Deltaproteobacteria bacterium]
MNHPEMLYALGSLGALLALFGAFLLLWRRYQHCVGGCTLNPRTRGVAWGMLLIGVMFLVMALLFAQPIPRFTP